MGPLAARTYEGKQLTKIHGSPAGRAKVALDYQHRPKGGFVFGALQPATGAVLTQMYSRRIVGARAKREGSHANASPLNAVLRV